MKLVGDTASGQPVFAIGPVQLTLPPGAHHFYPVGDCSRCGEIVEFPEPVLTVADLELSGQPHLCQRCARTGIDALGRARPSDGLAQSRGVGRAVPDASPASAPRGDAASSTAPGDLDAAWAPQSVDIEPPPQSLPASLSPQFVPAVPDGDGTDVEQLLRAEVDPSFGGVGQTRQPAEVNGTGDGFDRVGEYVAFVLRSATRRAEEIRADAERAAAGLLENAERLAAEKKAAATLIAEEANRDRDEVMALASQLEGTFAGEQQQLTLRLAEAEAQAAAIREAAEADAATVRAAAEADAVTIRETGGPDPEEAAATTATEEARQPEDHRGAAELAAAEADAARISEVADAEHAQASALLAEANAMADQQRRAGEATLDEANRQAATVLAAAEADAARLREGAEAAMKAAEDELEAAIALSADAGSSQAAKS